MRRTWTIIGVADVARSHAWYQALFGQPRTGPAHDDFEAALARARALVDRLAEEPRRSPGTKTMEFSLRDPDGYFVMINALAPGDAAGPGPTGPTYG